VIGGRESLEAFLEDMGERPAGRMIDRKDVNGNYELGNRQGAGQQPATCGRRADIYRHETALGRSCVPGETNRGRAARQGAGRCAMSAVHGPRFKWRSDLRRWVFDRCGIPESETARHGFRGLGRYPVYAPNAERRRQRQPEQLEASAVSDAERRHEALIARQAAEKAAKAAAKEAKRAASRERARIKRSAYFKTWWARVGKARRAERRGGPARNSGVPNDPPEKTVSLDPEARKERRLALARVRNRAWCAVNRRPKHSAIARHG
jgi:hypothetical protein